GAGASGNETLTQAPTLLRCSYVKTADRLYQHLFDHNDLILVNNDIGTLHRRLFNHSSDQPTLDATQTLLGYRTLLDKLDQMDSLTTTTRAQWLQEKTVKLGAGYDNLMLRVSKLPALGPDMLDKSNNMASAGFDRLTAQLASQINDSPIASVAWSDKDKRYQLKPEYVALRAGLTNLLAQNFVSPGNGKDLGSVEVNRNGINWDIKQLDQVLALQDVRRKYLGEAMGKLPPDTRESIQSFVDRRFVDHVSGMLVDAQSTPFNTSEDRDDLQNEADPTLLNFESARPRLVNILGFLDELGARQERRELIDVLSSDAGSRLRSVDDAMRRAEPFTVRDGDFSWWQGDRNPILVGFGVNDPVGLTQYLAQQISHIESLSQQAAPLVALLQGTGQRGDQTTLLVQRWTQIAHELERYKAKNPNSSIAQLEQFILSSGTELTRNNCVEKLSGHPVSNKSGDLFADRRNQLFLKLQARCHELKSNEGHDAWNTLADSFNHTVSGHYPFAAGSEAETQAAELDDIASFMRIYDRYAEAVNGSSVSDGGSPSNVRRFMDMMGHVRPFFAPLFPTDEAAIVGYDVSAAFRVDQSSELEGNKIADWSLAIGDQIVQQRDAAKPLVWTPGLPVTLTLRLAKDAPLVPVADSKQPAMRVEGKSVSFQSTDPWALLSFVQHYRDAEANGRGDGRSQVLRFEFPIQTVGNDGRALPGQTASLARVYVKLSVQAPGKHANLTWPSFPYKAPNW
ncbi:MAG: hypothetical protein JO218_18025, partial [Burkholderiales bacterium]|nr:hypothetical protein [Burkholderiales bacterium]